MNGNKDVSLVLSGEAGTGLKTIENLIVRVLKRSGLHVFAAKEVMSRIRGGNNTVEIRASSMPVEAFIRRIDILAALSAGSIHRLEDRLGEDTLIIGEKDNVEEKYRDAHRFVETPFTSMAEEAGDSIYANSVAAGVLSGMIGVGSGLLDERMERTFSGKGEEVLKANKKAAARGHAFGKEIAEKEGLSLDLELDDAVADDIVISGGEAVSLGAIAGGCNFISSYPMSPSTSVLVFLSQNAQRLGLVAEQAEDEISAINMALGAWYAGARAMVTTSGGGFALMAEGLSLAGMIESPMVIHLGQRPGPATGLPTRTGQEDLLFALRAGHGFFPRAIFAPGTIEEAYELSRKAFDLADSLQIPVIVLTDQHLVDSVRNLGDLDTGGQEPVKGFVETAADYRRFEITDDGISPRGVPGHGEGLVMVDSDEHDEYGRITEDRDVRRAMVEKRLRKAQKVREAALAPVLTGGDEYEVLVAGWGSTFPVIKEALSATGAAKVSSLHFRQVYPLHSDVPAYLEKAKKLVVVENNATSQLGQLLRLETGRSPDESILKYDGHPFSVEGLAERLEEVL